MKRCLLLGLALIVAAPAIAGGENRSAPGVAARPPLDVLADFFLPGAPLIALIDGECRTGYRTKMSKNADDIALEKAIPGIHDAMVAAASASCNQAMAGYLASHHAAIKADWSHALAPADLARLAAMVAPATQEALDVNVDFRPGDLGADAVDRMKVTEEQDQRFTRAQQAFAQTPGGVAILNRVSAYQAKMNASFSNPEDVGAIIRAALVAAHKAANDYAKAKGFESVYRE